MQQEKSRAPSITGGLPLLLLSVLRPVIPRSSWPSVEHMSVPMRRSVTFSSQPHMDEEAERLPAIDLLNLRLKHQKCMENKSILDKIKGKSNFASNIKATLITMYNITLSQIKEFSAHELQVVKLQMLQ